MSKTVVGLGEVLWDVFPEEQLLGGAPANVAYHASALGNEGLVASRVGEDELGDELRRELSKRGLDTTPIQTDPTAPTGTVQVTFSDRGDPRYEIVRDVAWDCLEWTSEWQTLAERSSAVCYSTLAQRETQSRTTVERFLEATAPHCVRVLDVNLRPPFVNEDILRSSIAHATVVKYNYQEGRFLKRLFWQDDLEAWLCKEQGIGLVCVTRGADGAELFTQEEHVTVAAGSVDTSQGDPVGAGDAYSAALIDGLLKGLPLEEVAQRANRYAGLVASLKGGMPEVPSPF